MHSKVPEAQMDMGLPRKQAATPDRKICDTIAAVLLSIHGQLHSFYPQRFNRIFQLSYMYWLYNFLIEENYS